jgi:4-hydroxybenzoate polyprenyltransferase
MIHARTASPTGRGAAGIPVRQGEARVFSRVTVGFGVAIIAVCGLAALVGATTFSTAIVPAILGGLFILLGWLGRKTPLQPSPRQRSPSLFSTILAAALVFSSARGISLILDALSSGTTPTATGVFLFLMALAGAGYIVFGAWTDIAEARRIARARSTAPARRRSGR